RWSRKRTNRCRRRLRPRNRGGPGARPAGGSSPAFEAKGEPLRKPGFSDRTLRPLDVVAHTAELDRLLVHIPDPVAGGGQSVAWLSDAPWVHQRRPAQRKGVHAILVRHGAVRHAEDAGNGAGAGLVADAGRTFAVQLLVGAALRIASIAGDVAEAKCLVDLRSVAQHSLERVPVGVDVGEDRDPQAGLS